MRTWSCAVLILVALLGACRFSVTNNASVEVPGDANPDTKLQIAETVATQVWESGLVETIRKQFPELTDADLAGLGIRWHTFTLKPMTGEDREPKATISIRCIFQHQRGMDFGQPVVELCKSIVTKALDTYMAQGSAA